MGYFFFPRVHPLAFTIYEPVSRFGRSFAIYDVSAGKQWWGTLEVILNAANA